MNRLGHTQTRRVADRQDDALLHAFHRAQERGDFVGTQHGGQSLGLPAGRDINLDPPCASKGDGVAKPQRGHGDAYRAGRQVFVPGQVKQPAPDLAWSQVFRRPVKVAGEPGNLLNIRLLGLWGEVANLHILDHAKAKRGHYQLLCEMSGATWRRRNRLADEESGQGKGSGDRHEQNPPHCRNAAQVTRLPRSGLVQCGVCGVRGYAK
jgi:hypothetical protein